MAEISGDDENREERAKHYAEYRKHLVTAEQKSQEDFDKTVLSLSGGALGISFVFLKDVIGPNPVSEPTLLFYAWAAWGGSTFCVLASYYLSHLALRNTIKQIDQDRLHKEKPGTFFSTATAFLNALGAILFLIGVCNITLFANANLKTKGATNVKTENSKPITSSATNPTAQPTANNASATPTSH